MPCPICAKPTDPERRPFCSRRCADADLSRWMRGAYRIPTEEAPDTAPVMPCDDDDRDG
jgi:endogenous inhibitor of DNA gyrase (YacG/DUF329 family)